MFLIIIIVLSFILYSLYRYFTRTFSYWKNRKITGPKPVPIFGNIKDSALRKVHISMAIKKIYDDFPNEQVVGIFRMTTPCLLVRDLDVIKAVMIKDFEYFTDRGINFSNEGLGANLFHSDGDTWRVTRKRFSPIFTTGKLNCMMPLINGCGEKFIEYVHGVSGTQSELEMHTLFMQYMISTTAACVFGLDIDTFTEDQKRSLKTLDDLIFNMSFVYELDMMYPGILKTLNSSLFPAKVTEFFMDLVKTVISQRKGMPSSRKDFMDTILELMKQSEFQDCRGDFTLEITEGVIAAQAFSFYAAGYETSATTLTHMMYHLALNPEIQDKLIEEIDYASNKCEGRLTFNVISEMPYLERVFDETLRVHPIVDPLMRNAKSDYKIPGTDITIEKGQTVLVSLAGIHHDKKYYTDPEKFDPERFSPRITGERHSCAYMPFGVGPRNCLGLRFAKLISRVCVIKFLSTFRVEPCKNTNMRLKCDPWRMLMSPEGGIYLNVVRRNK